MPQTLLLPLTATIVLFFVSLIVPDAFIFTTPWIKGVCFPSWACSQCAQMLLDIYGTAPVEPTAVVVVEEDVPRRQKKQCITSRRG